ncbi:hypothetical protein M092_2056 [Parabacteroides distasonis str. 3776 D15 iv]|nr:hypothetical protein M090_1139 [Parabacteroides distasonis str. 3776 Po2 i]KDS71592.1 hypothetical protein M092_2056 [Parabacteroides distasonis str. 3776 D15 iv]
MVIFPLDEKMLFYINVRFIFSDLFYNKFDTNFHFVND